MTNKLPDKPSELIRVALADMKKAQDKGHRIDMDHWSVEEGKKCAVCLAGALMAETGDAGYRKFDPDDFDVETRKKLYAIDDFRQGMVNSGLVVMGLSHPKPLIHTREFRDFHLNAVGFAQDMNDLADELEAEGF